MLKHVSSNTRKNRKETIAIATRCWTQLRVPRYRNTLFDVMAVTSMTIWKHIIMVDTGMPTETHIIMVDTGMPIEKHIIMVDTRMLI